MDGGLVVEVRTMPGVDIKKDDTVRAISGKDRGREGRVVRVLPRDGRVMVDGVALAKKHQRSTGRRAKGAPSSSNRADHRRRDVRGHLQRPGRVPGCGKATRLGHRVEGDRKVRFCRKCETELS